MAIQTFSFDANQTTPISQFSSVNASSLPIARGSGESRAYAVHFEPGSVIGPHPAGFDQVFLVVQGCGWIAGSDGVKRQLGTFEGGYVPLGEIHSKGSERGMVAIMLQASQYAFETNAEAETGGNTDA